VNFLPKRICITGTPGVGKSTISKLLVNKLNELGYNYKLIDISKLVKEKGFYSHYDEVMDSYVVDFKKLNNYLNGLNEYLILDGHVSHMIDNIDYIVVLRCDIEVLKSRLENRNYSKNKVIENINAEILDVCLIESLENCNKVYEIDTTNRSPNEIVEKILQSILNGKVEYGKVDWISKYSDYLV